MAELGRVYRDALFSPATKCLIKECNYEKTITINVRLEFGNSVNI